MCCRSSAVEQRRDGVLADALNHELNDVDRARIAFARAMNRLFTLGDPAGAKSLIDDAARNTPPQARRCIDAFLAVYWAAMGKPAMVKEIVENLDWEKLRDAGAARATAWAITVALGDAGAASDAVATAESGYPIPVRALLCPHRRPTWRAAAGGPGHRGAGHCQSRRPAGGRFPELPVRPNLRGHQG